MHFLFSLVQNQNTLTMNRKEFLKNTIASGIAASVLPSLIKNINGDSVNDMKPKVIRADEGKTINVIGDVQTFKLTGKDTNGQFTLIEEENHPGVMIPMHVHTKEDEVFKVVEGQMELTVGEETTVLKEGDIGFGPRGVPHSWKIIGDQKAKVILSVFPSGIEFMFEELGQLPAGPPDFPKVAEICGRFGVSFV